MARRKWKVLPGGKLKQWKASKHPRTWGGVPPHWYRNMLNRRERRLADRTMHEGCGQLFPLVHPRGASWYW
jgi:hypothetical protein